jgi:signal transduction histidine kinase
MRALLVSSYLTLYEVLICVVLAVGICVATFWVVWRRWREQYSDLERSLVDRLQALYGNVESVIAHRWSQHLDFISSRSTETLEALSEDQDALRVKQRQIRAKADELHRHASNVMRAFDPERKKPPRPEVLDVNRLLYSVLATFYDYADDRQVTLVPKLASIGLTVLDGDLTAEAYEPVIHNAIKYSFEGRVVEIALSLEKRTKKADQKAICLRVIGRGEVIPEKDRERIFQLRERADGLVEPGQGLGLYVARNAARLQGGDVILVKSNAVDGTVFLVVLPYTEMIALDQ